MKTIDCIHVKEKSLAPLGGACVISFARPTEPDSPMIETCSATLCPLCLGFLYGTLGRLAEGGIAAVVRPSGDPPDGL